jgi:Zn-dependent protease
VDGSIARFQVLGFQVNVQAGFLFICAFFLLVGLSDQDPIWDPLAFCAVMFVSIIIHELGHALACRRLRVPVIGDVEIHGFGGHVTHRRSTSRNQLKISLAGPAAGLLFGLPWLIPYLYVDLPEPARVVLLHVLWINIGWSLMNLIPTKPLDGGNAFHAVMDIYTNPKQAAYISGVLGFVLGIIIAAFGWRFNSVVLGLIGVYVAYINAQAIQQSQSNIGR